MHEATYSQFIAAVAIAVDLKCYLLVVAGSLHMLSKDEMRILMDSVARCHTPSFRVVAIPDKRSADTDSIQLAAT
jgi:hypothetical protein